MTKRILFIDRDGTLIKEPEDDFQVDSLDKLEFYPGIFRNLYFICKNLDFKIVMVSNQDGMGTLSYPEEAFNLVQKKILQAFENENIYFEAIHIDKSFPGDNLPTRKPGTAMLMEYFSDEYDLKNSYVIGDRITDIILAKNLGARGILISNKILIEDIDESYKSSCNLITSEWDKIYSYLASGERKAKVQRITGETNILIELDLDGTGKSDIHTGLGFFDHMLDQISRHSGVDLTVNVKGDLQVDEHHTIEDTAIALGEVLLKTLGNKRGLERYGFVLPMDDCLSTVALDFGGRSWLVWNAEFKREKIGDVPTEMFYHFFKSLTDSAHMNLNVHAEGTNEHHKIESIFKAFARALKNAIRRDVFNDTLPSTKEML